LDLGCVSLIVPYVGLDSLDGHAAASQLCAAFLNQGFQGCSLMYWRGQRYTPLSMRYKAFPLVSDSLMEVVACTMAYKKHVNK